MLNASSIVVPSIRPTTLIGLPDSYPASNTNLVFFNNGFLSGEFSKCSIVKGPSVVTVIGSLDVSQPAKVPTVVNGTWKVRYVSVQNTASRLPCSKETASKLPTGFPGSGSNTETLIRSGRPEEDSGERHNVLGGSKPSRLMLPETTSSTSGPFWDTTISTSAWTHGARSMKAIHLASIIVVVLGRFVDQRRLWFTSIPEHGYFCRKTLILN